jgi:hypothetical protein
MAPHFGTAKNGRHEWPPGVRVLGEYPFLGGATPRVVPSGHCRIWDRGPLVFISKSDGRNAVYFPMFFALQSISETSEDSKISTDVRGLLELHTDLGPPNSIHVNTIKHVVYLSGLVGTGLGDREAEDIARQAPGVARVVNSVAVEQ